MEKPTFKLVGAPCGQHGQYTFYKAIRLSFGQRERIVAIGDFFFVRIWQDSELVSVGELQLLWTDRVSDQTLVSLRLYFLPENTPDGRNQHGEDEVLAINDKVVVRAEDLLSWACDGAGWRWGLRAVWRGACAPPPPADATQPLHHTKLDFSDVDREKCALVDTESPGVVVFSYPRYCRYRALLARLEGIQADWLRDSLVAALGGYAAPTTNTRILYCRDTFEYPELEGHEFVCNELAPKLKGRPRGRRRRASPGASDGENASGPESGSETTLTADVPQTPRRLSLRNGGERADISSSPQDAESRREDKAFLAQLKQFHRDGQICPPNDLSLRSLYCKVQSLGGYEAVSRRRRWRELGAQPARCRRHYERYLLPYERHAARRPPPRRPATAPASAPASAPAPAPAHAHALAPVPLLRSPVHDLTETEPTDSKDDMNYVSKPAEELNREFLESLPKEEEKPDKSEKPVKSDKPVKLSPEKPVKLSPEKPAKISVKPVEELVEPKKLLEDEFSQLAKVEPLVNHKLSTDNPVAVGAAPLGCLSSLSALGDKYVNGHDAQPSRPAARSSLRAVRVKAGRPPHAAHHPHPHPHPLPHTGLGVRSETASSPLAINNFGIHRPPPPDDDIVEVPYQPKTPEIIDLDEYPESPQSVKKKKLDILKERGLEVTAVPAWPVPPSPLPPLITPSPVIINPAMPHPILTHAQLFQMYNILPPHFNGMKPPKVIQATSIYGTSGPEKTVYGNPKDPFMPPPHVLLGAPLKPARAVSAATPPQHILDLTCKVTPAVEIVKVPNTNAQNLTKNYTLLDGKAVVGSNLEITLVNRSQTPNKLRSSQKRSSNGKFVSSKTPTPPKEPPRSYPSPSPKKNSIVVPNYQMNPRDNVSPTSSTGSRDSVPGACGGGGGGGVGAGGVSVDPMYAAALYPRRLQAFRDALADQIRGYSGLLSLSAVTGTPTTKN